MLAALAENSWTRELAGHLLNRAGFGGSPETVAAWHKLGLRGAVGRLLEGAGKVAAAEGPKPEWARPRGRQAERREILSDLMAKGLRLEPGQRPRDVPEVRAAFQERQREQRQNGMALVVWWLERMRGAENPLVEKMTLFWHGSFATSMEKVKDAYLMWKQNDLFRRHALGNFGGLVKAICRDPAMMTYLDLQTSDLQKPNENFARELMELFTLGQGNYTEEDIRESARAFTGHRISEEDQSFEFDALRHDAGTKTFFGKTGNFGADGIVDAILDKPVCAEFMVRKVWEFFAYEEPEPRLVAGLAAGFRASGYETGPLLREIFLSAEFYSERAVRAQIKSPVQWLVQLTRTLEIAALPPTPMVLNALKSLGQVPFLPPNVKGWDGGAAWITTSTLLQRYNLAATLLYGPGDGGGGQNGGADDPMAQVMDDLGVAAPQAPAGRPGAGRFFRRRIGVDLERIAPRELRGDSPRLVTALEERLFQTRLPADSRVAFIRYWDGRKRGRGEDEEGQICGLLHLMMSTPEFQLC